MRMSQRLPTLLALAAATAISAGGLAAACPETLSVDTTPAPETTAKIVHVREVMPPPILERLGLFGVVPFVAGYGVTSILCRRGRRRRRRHHG